MKSPKKRKGHENGGEETVMHITDNVDKATSIIKNKKKVKEEPEINEEKTEKDGKKKKSKRKHSVISHNVVVDKEVDEVLNDSEGLTPKKKKKKKKIG